MIGSTFVARCARECSSPIAATQISNNEIRANVAGSVAVTPNSNVDITRVKMNAAMRPMTTPAIDEFQAITDSEFQHGACLCAERHANADLVRSLGHRVTHHAVDSHRGEYQRHTGEDREQQHAEALSSDRVEEYLFHRSDVRNWLVLVDLPDSLPHRRREARRIHFCLHHQISRLEEARLPVTEIHLRPWFGSQFKLAHVFHDANHLNPVFRPLEFSQRRCACRSDLRRASNGAPSFR